MQKPQKDLRYLISKDGGKTVCLMRFACDSDGQANTDGGVYTLKMSAEHPHDSDIITFDTNESMMMIGVEAWDDDYFDSEFEIIKVFIVSSISKPTTVADEPTVYFVPDGKDTR